ncbi:GntR family transcriptional regulator [Mycetocola saprophilus]|uniref:GntR family transcriptional regulator n=1 Tax=Mycetocola saprophilus TaxID=76636 RepID=UPI003BF52183
MPLPTPRTRVVRKTLADSVYDDLYDAILSGDLAPGEILNDKAIAETYGMSRTPVREALRKLSLYQLVEMVPSKYNRVMPSDERSILEAANTMYGLYEVCVREGIAHVDEAARTKLERLAASIAVAAQDEDRRPLTEDSYQYFRLLAELSGNVLLPDLLHQVAPQASRVLAPRAGVSAPDIVGKTFAAIHRAVLDGDRDAALVALHTMTEPSREAFRRLMREVD